jgi:hypothetical protein
VDPFEAVDPIEVDQLDLACPYCAGRFQAPAAAAGRAATCPHCGRSVTVPATPPQALPPSPPDPRVEVVGPAVPGVPFNFIEPPKVLVNRRGEPVALRRLSPDERERYRHRLNLAFALAGMAILAFALALLLRLRP